MEQGQAPFNSLSATGCAEFDYGPGQPNLYLLMRYKQSLVAQLGIRKGFEAYKQRLHLPQSLMLEELPIEGEYEFARSQASFFAQTGGAGESFFHAPPQVVGEGNHRPVTGTTRAQYIARLSDARVRGRSAAVIVSGRLLLDFQGGELERLDDEWDWDPAIFGTQGSVACHIPAANRAQPLELKEAFSLLGAHTDFFGHWMCEYLPKYAAAAMSGTLPDIPVLIDANMPASHRRSLSLLYPGTKLVEVPAFLDVAVERLWIAPTLMYMPLHEKRNERFRWDHVSASPQRFEPVLRELADRSAAALESTEQASSRVFLARKDFRHRKLVNSAEIEEVAAAKGFAIVYPEDLAFDAQVRAVRDATHLLASEGSAIFLAFFATQGAKLAILSHPLTDVLADYNGLLATRGVHVSAFTGPIVRHNPSTPHDSDYRIDSVRFRRFLCEWLR